MLCLRDSLNIKFYINDDSDIVIVDLFTENIVKKPDQKIDEKKLEISAYESFDIIDFYKKELIIIDLRDPDLFAKGSIDKSINVNKESLLKSPELFLDQASIYFIYGDLLSDDELTEIKKKCQILYYMKSSFEEWQLAAIKYFETKIK